MSPRILYLTPDCGRRLAGDSYVSGAAGVWALLASSPAEPPPTGLMSPRILYLTLDCGRRLAGDGCVSGAAGVWALLASSPAEPPPTGLMSPRILCPTPDCGRHKLCWRWLCVRRSRCVGLAGLIAGRAASHRIDVAQDLGPGTRLWKAQALLAMAVCQTQQVYGPCWPHRRQSRLPQG